MNLVLIAVVIVGRASAGGVWSDRPTEARLDQKPELAVVVVAREGKRRLYVADAAIEPLEIGGRRIRASQRASFDAVGDVAVRWFQVEPEAWRADGNYHSNVSTEPADFGRWIGYDPITYRETALGRPSTAASARRRRAAVIPSRSDEDLHGGLGTIRYKVEVTAAGTTLASPGAEATDTLGISPRVHRVSIRRDDTIVGHLTAYFLVPEVFGSAGGGANHQTERYTGADCADVITGAVRRAGHGSVWHTNVAGLTAYADVIAGPVAVDERGQAADPITGVAVGDIIRIDYGGSLTNHTPRSWDHVALLFEDRSDPDDPRPNGQLDGFDRVIHMGHPRLEVEPLSGQSPARIDVLRWVPRKLDRRRTKKKGR